MPPPPTAPERSSSIDPEAGVAAPLGGNAASSNGRTAASPNDGTAAPPNGSTAALHNAGAAALYNGGAAPITRIASRRRRSQPDPEHRELKLGCCNVPYRPDTWNRKTRETEWRALQSPWRWMHGLFFYMGKPGHLFLQFWQPFTFNMILAIIVSIDYLMTMTSQGKGPFKDGFLPNRPVDDGLANMESLVRFMLVAVAAVVSIRINRVFDRWWTARQAFSAMGSVAVALAQRAYTWIGPAALPPDAPAAAVAAATARRDAIVRWSVVWHYSIMQMATFEDKLHPDAAELLTPAELELYNATRKPRQLATMAILEEATASNLSVAQVTAFEDLLSKGNSAAGTVGAIRFQAMPDGLVLVVIGFVETILIMVPLSWFSTPSPDPKKGPADAWPYVTSVVLSLMLYVFINFLFLGALAACDLLEDPFPMLPLHDIVDTTRRDVLRVKEHVDNLARVRAGDRGGDVVIKAQ